MLSKLLAKLRPAGRSATSYTATELGREIWPGVREGITVTPVGAIIPLGEVAYYSEENARDEQVIRQMLEDEGFSDEDVLKLLTAKLTGLERQGGGDYQRPERAVEKPAEA